MNICDRQFVNCGIIFTFTSLSVTLQRIDVTLPQRFSI